MATSLWKSSLLSLALAGLCAPLSGAQSNGAFDGPGGLGGDGPGTLFDRQSKPPAYDKTSLQDEVEETLPLFDALARESRLCDKAVRDALFKSLDRDFKLGDLEDDARIALDRCERVLEIEDALRNQEALLKKLRLGTPEYDAQEGRLRAMNSDQTATEDDVRKVLSGQQKNLNESETRDLRSWLMVSEGTLRHRREDAEAAAAGLTRTPQAPLSAQGLTPPASARADSGAPPLPTPPPGTPGRP